MALTKLLEAMDAIETVTDVALGEVCVAQPESLGRVARCGKSFAELSGAVIDLGIDFNKASLDKRLHTMIVKLSDAAIKGKSLVCTANMNTIDDMALTGEALAALAKQRTRLRDGYRSNAV